MTLLAAVLTLILLALFVSDKTPRRALYTAARETLKGLRRARLPLPRLEKALGRLNERRAHSSPYRRIGKDIRHRPLLLNLPTSEGGGEAAHPDVLRVPEGWGADGWTWLMAATPYPSGNDFHENPELYVSFDGLTWIPPAEGVNPLAAVPVETARRDLKKEFHSDASLLLRDGTLSLYYRWTGVRSDGGMENRIYVKTSRDGLRWSDRAPLIEEVEEIEKKPGTRERGARTRQFLSPSVLFADGEYQMRTVEYEAGKRMLALRTSRDGRTWSPPRAETVLSDYTLSEPWHLDATEAGHGDTQRRILLLTAAKDRGFDATLHLGFGDKNGNVWRMAGKLIDPGYFFESGRVYRASLVPGDERDAYFLYYSALSGDGTWHVARVLLTIDAEQETFSHKNSIHKRDNG